MKFRNVCEVKKRLVQSGLIWNKTLSILLSMNGESVPLPVRQHFKQFYCRQFKNGQLDEMSVKVSEM